MLNALSIIFLLLTFLCLVMLIVGLVKPDKVLWKSKVTTRGRVIRVYSLAAIISFVLCFACVINSSSDSKTASSAAATKTKETEHKDKQPVDIDKQMEKELKVAAKKVVYKKNIVKTEINLNAASENKNDRIAMVTLKARSEKESNILIDAAYFLEELAKSKDTNISELVILFNANLVDEYGKKSNANVMKIVLDRETLNKINYHNLLGENIPKIAKDYWKTPALQ